MIEWQWPMHVQRLHNKLTSKTKNDVGMEMAKSMGNKESMFECNMQNHLSHVFYGIKYCCMPSSPALLHDDGILPCYLHFSVLLSL